jgi:hypothetical protein
MTAAHTTLLTHLLELLDQVPYLVLRRAPTAAGEVGYVDFDTKMVTISDQASAAQATVTLMHEIQHLRRGPCYVGDEEKDEAAVVEATTRLLVPSSELPPILEAADPHQLALELGVTVRTVRHGIALARQDQATDISEVA